MTYVDLIIERFGGVRALATAIGKAPSTVQGWKDRGTIPDDKKVIVLAAGAMLTIPLVEADFFPRASSGEAA